MSALQLPAEAQAAARSPRRVIRSEAVGAWLLAFVPTAYLALSGGGYDIVARSEIGVLLWWIVLLGVLVGVLPRTRLSAAAWIAIALLGGFFAWTWIATGWSQSEELTLVEAARISTYLAVLVLGLSMTTRASVRPLLFGLASAIAVVSLIAVLSRLVPSWFPADQAASFYATARLGYPFDYSDGVGEFAAFGVPLLLFASTGARTLAGRALAAAAIPVVVLCLALTVSRGGILAAAVGLVCFYALAPDRIPRLASSVASAAASTVAVVALLHRSGVQEVLSGQAPAGQRHSMLAVLALSAVGAALLEVGTAVAARSWKRPRLLRFSRRRARAIATLLVAAVTAVVAVGVASGTANHLWQQFKQPNLPTTGTSYTRLLSIAGSHRYQYWVAAVDAFETSPWKGIGPGTFRFYWSQHDSLDESVLNAHSLYLETLAEAGIVGLAPIGAFLVLALAVGSARALRSTGASRLAIATATAGLAGFCAAAAFDWVWQIGVMPMIAMLLVAGALVEPGAAGSPDEPELIRIGPAPRLRATRAILGLLTLPALWAIAVPLSATIALRSSQAAARSGQFRNALADARTAERIEPAAASPRLQRALLLEQLDDVGGALRAITQAEAREPTNWQIWLIASRIATEANRPELALADYRRARKLNPTASVFRR